MEIVMLGTGYAMAERCYNTCFALVNGEEALLVDAGGGNQIFGQLAKAGIPYENIRAMFITHAHTDHILGAIWLVRKMAALIHKKSYTPPFHIYCHDEAADALLQICRLTLPAKFIREFGETIILHTVGEGDTASVAGMELTFFDIHSTKLKQFGFRSLLPDGKRLACLGDEPYNPECRRFVENSDWLLCEAFCRYEDREIFHPYEKHHSTVRDAGTIAGKLGVKNLLLYHTEDRSLDSRKESYTAEAKSVFDGNVYVPYDLERIKL
ncbi:MAG: MBL fold metallo-hydrolase [Paludibacteraceae bacterium]|nr:MBL fold metallo-hydrolase [Paludibacteraceae bacterium]